MNQFTKRYAQLIGAKEVSALMSAKVKGALVVNTLKISKKDLLTELKQDEIELSSLAYSDSAYRIQASKKPVGAIANHLLGRYYLMDSGSIAVAEALGASKKELILDMCASPGGKLVYSAIRMENSGRMLALDLKHRIPALKNNIERMGISNTLCYPLKAESATDLGVAFDKILLDAPCSGSFMSEPAWFSKRSIMQFKEKAKIQKNLLRQGVEVLKRRGTLIYATCSLEPEENEEVIDWALTNLDVELQHIDLPIGSSGFTEIFGRTLHPETSKCKRLWPHIDQTEPFFIAKLKKR